jgi:DNA repair protein RecO (recombination protein O)
LHTLREVSLRETHPALRQDINCLQQAAYCSQLIEQATETDTPLPAVYDLMHGLLGHLSGQPPQRQTIFVFELKLLSELGLKPDLERSHLTAGSKQLVNAFVTTKWEAVSRLKPSETQVRELRQFLHGFVVFHVGRIPKGRPTG